MYLDDVTYYLQQGNHFEECNNQESGAVCICDKILSKMESDNNDARIQEYIEREL